ncbi:MAG: preprotein translocase subunit SecA [Crocinitomicaceae bacterium]
MLGGILKKFVGDKNQKDSKEYQPYVTKINQEFEKLNGISDDQLRGKSDEFRKIIQDGLSNLEKRKEELLKEIDENPAMDVHQKEDIYQEIDKLDQSIDDELELILLDLMPEAFAVVKETARRWAINGKLEVTARDMDREIAAKRKGVEISGDKAIWHNSWEAAGNEVQWNMVHYDVQLYGGAVLHKGNIAEMQTGEGKTLVATLPVYLNALAGKGVHVVTVNDYLAKRDSEWMGPLYEFHGLSVDCIDKHRPNSPERRKAYASNITFGTNNEFGFDYLRDNMSSNTDDLVQKKHHFAIVDEVDSVLIDDARTPLIISGPTPKGDQQEYEGLKPKIETLVSAQRKLVQELLVSAKKNLATLNEDKPSKEDLKQGGIELLRCYRGLPKNKALIKFLSEPGVRAHLQKTENYYLQDQQKEMPFIDNELFFTIDEKNNQIDLTDKGIELISKGEDSNYYILTDIASEFSQLDTQGLTSEEKVARKDAIIRDYTVKSERIHSINQLLKAYTLFEKEVEYVLMDGKVKIVDEQTGRIMEGRRYSDGLHQAIEAKENVKIEDATQTYATISLQNYFRMYHKLSGMTGTAETEAQEFWDIYELDVVVIPTNRPIARKDQHDLVYKTAREKYNAIIDEIDKLVGQNRPVLVGTTTVEISELLSRMLKMRNIPHQVLNAKLHQKEADIVAEAGKAGTVTIATNMAGRGTDIKLGEGVKDAGGLAIIGTERHDSRRVDRQLRGGSRASGRPWFITVFCFSEDPLMRLFGSERIAKMMDRLGLKEGEVIQHRMISKSIERAQKKVEENNFGMRKRLLEYDDVMNAQRKAIYKKRKNALYGDRLDMDIANMFYDIAESVVINNHTIKDFENFQLDLIKELGIESPMSLEEFSTMSQHELTEKIFDTAEMHYKRIKDNLSTRAYPIIKQVYENEGQKFKNMQFPVTDGIKSMNVIVNLEDAYNDGGLTLVKEIEKSIVLGFIDNEWKEHLREMDDLRQSVQNARFEQKDPLLQYKLKSFELFKEMLARLSNEIISFIVKAQLPVRSNSEEVEVKRTNEEAHPKSNYGKSTLSRESAPEFKGSEGYQQAIENSGNPQKQVTQPITAEKKVGRNDPCPCGSGKKYKQCHGK